MKEKIKKSAKKFKEEIKKSTNTAIVAAFSFMIALAWRDLISEYLSTLTKIPIIQGKLLSAIIITSISVIGILITTKLLSLKQ